MTTSNQQGLSLQNLSKSFGGNQVLSELSIDIEPGKLLSLLGPSGCGKTTTLNIIAGFLEPDEGKVLLGGQDITHAKPNQRDTAIVFQNYALFPHMQVFENVAYGLKVRKLATSEIKQRTNRMLEMLGIAHLADRYPGQLSGGQQQRVSLARALNVQPSLLLLDEPLSNLDAKLRQGIRAEIRAFQQQLEQTAVFVTHDQEEALAISDYIAVLNLGWLEQVGSPETLWQHPRTVYVADFMGLKNIMALEDLSALGRPVDPKQLPVNPELGNAPTTHVAVRSDKLNLHTQPGQGGDVIEFAATVHNRIYSGGQYICNVTNANGKEFQTMQSPLDTPVEPGQEVYLSFNASDAITLTESTVQSGSDGVDPLSQAIPVVR